jgi:hypothetical protein
VALTLSEGAANCLSAVFTFNAEACLESYTLEGPIASRLKSDYIILTLKNSLTRAVFYIEA